MKWVYKIVSALCAIGVLPLMVFSPLIYYYFSSLVLQGIFGLGQLFGSETLQEVIQSNGLESAPKGIADSLSVYDIFETASSLSNVSGSGDFLEAVKMLIPTAIATVVAFILIAVCTIVTVVLAFACKDNRKVIASSFAGIGCSFLFTILFESLVAPILNGTIGISDLLGTVWGSLIAEPEVITVTTTFYFIPALFGFIALWTVLYNATLPDKEKEARKKLIG